MKRSYLLICLCLSLNSLFAQTSAPKDTVEFESVQVEAQFPGGMEGWKEYLEGTLKTDLLEKCAKLKKGQKMVKQTVIVSFRVDKDGSISHVVAENASEVCPKMQRKL